MPDPNLHNPDPNLPGGSYGLLGVIGTVAIGIWESLRYAAKAMRFPRAKGLENGSLDRLSRLESSHAQLKSDVAGLKTDLNMECSGIRSVAGTMRIEFDTFRNIEFPSHANKIHSAEIAIREMSDRQNEMLGELESMVREQRVHKRLIEDVRDAIRQLQRGSA